MSAAEQFKGAVTSASGPAQGWRGGLERSRATARWSGAASVNKPIWWLFQRMFA